LDPNGLGHYFPFGLLGRQFLDFQVIPKEGYFFPLRRKDLVKEEDGWGFKNFSSSKGLPKKFG